MYTWPDQFEISKTLVRVFLVSLVTRAFFHVILEIKFITQKLRKKNPKLFKILRILQARKSRQIQQTMQKLTSFITFQVNKLFGFLVLVRFSFLDS